MRGYCSQTSSDTESDGFAPAYAEKISKSAKLWFIPQRSSKISKFASSTAYVAFPSFQCFSYKTDGRFVAPLCSTYAANPYPSRKNRDMIEVYWGIGGYVVNVQGFGTKAVVRRKWKANHWCCFTGRGSDIVSRQIGIVHQIDRCEINSIYIYTHAIYVYDIAFIYLNNLRHAWSCWGIPLPHWKRI